MTEKPDAKNSLLSRITIETALYGALLVVSLMLRLADLDARPMSAAEAARALGAWQLAQGQEPTVVGSPLLTHTTTLIFFLFGAGDFMARLLPAFFGALLVLVPYFWRERLGHAGAFLAAVLLTVSPLSLFTSRWMGPEVLAAGLGLALATALVRFADTGAPRALYATAVLLGLLLTSGPGAYFILLVLAAVMLAAWGLGRGGNPEVLALQKRLAAGSAHRRKAAFVFLGTVLAVGTLLLFHVQGLRGLGDVLDEWWRGFGVAGALPWFSPLLWPALYEPVVMVFGVVGGVRAVRERDLLGSSLLGCALGLSVMLAAWP
ncbi:MAG: glycosyltransferase family 39 protein, partial [Anaerolineae bacterium]|nr:glycosyltransferase family 39 protein [Anaerolineae bacterium]